MHDALVSLPSVYAKPSRQRGFISIKLALILFTIGIGIMVVLKVVPAYYEFNILKDLANRIVTEYPGQKRIQDVELLVMFELRRNNITLPGDDAFEVTETAKGFRVVIDYQIPLDFSVFGQPIVIEKYKELDFFYEVES
jgi:hypothetical protein